VGLFLVGAGAGVATLVLVNAVYPVDAGLLGYAAAGVVGGAIVVWKQRPLLVAATAWLGAALIATYGSRAMELGAPLWLPVAVLALAALGTYVQGPGGGGTRAGKPPHGTPPEPAPAPEPAAKR
jgi:hypothetical protein